MEVPDDSLKVRRTSAQSHLALNSHDLEKRSIFFRPVTPGAPLRQSDNDINLMKFSRRLQKLTSQANSDTDMGQGQISKNDRTDVDLRRNRDDTFGNKKIGAYNTVADHDHDYQTQGEVTTSGVIDPGQCHDLSDSRQICDTILQPRVLCSVPAATKMESVVFETQTTALKVAYFPPAIFGEGHNQFDRDFDRQVFTCSASVSTAYSNNCNTKQENIHNNSDTNCNECANLEGAEIQPKSENTKAQGKTVAMIRNQDVFKEKDETSRCLNVNAEGNACAHVPDNDNWEMTNMDKAMDMDRGTPSGDTNIECHNRSNQTFNNNTSNNYFVVRNNSVPCPNPDAMEPIQIPMRAIYMQDLNPNQSAEYSALPCSNDNYSPDPLLNPSQCFTPLRFPPVQHSTMVNQNIPQGQGQSQPQGGHDSYNNFPASVNNISNARPPTFIRRPSNSGAPQTFIGQVPAYYSGNREIGNAQAQENFNHEIQQHFERTPNDGGFSVNGCPMGGQSGDFYNNHCNLAGNSLQNSPQVLNNNFLDKFFAQMPNPNQPNPQQNQNFNLIDPTGQGQDPFGDPTISTTTAPFQNNNLNGSCLFPRENDVPSPVNVGIGSAIESVQSPVGFSSKPFGQFSNNCNFFIYNMTGKSGLAKGSKLPTCYY